MDEGLIEWDVKRFVVLEDFDMLGGNGKKLKVYLSILILIRMMYRSDGDDEKALS